MPPIYLRLANSLEEMILRRALRPGDRIPSVREFGLMQRVSVPTALNAYATLEARGLIEARPKSGFYVTARRADAIPGLLPSEPAAKVSDLAHSDPLEMLAADQHHPARVPLGSALPDPAILPGARLSRLLTAAARRLGSEAGSYEAPGGAVVLRREIARRSVAAGFAIPDPDDVLVMNGATEAISLALFATCSPGDTVVVESPTFFGIIRQLREHGLKALPVAVDPTTGICLDSLARALARGRPKALLLVPNYHNPVGCVVPEAGKRELVRLAASRGVPIIEDDIYGDLQHRGPRPHTLKAYDQDDNVLYVSSFSKNIAPGYRVGWIAGGKWHERLRALKKTHSGSNPALPSLAVGEFLQSGGYDRHMRSFREACRQQVSTMRDAISQSFPPGIRLSRPEGGFILWCELPRSVDSLELFRRSRVAGVSVAPGPLFSTDGSFRNFIRINCGLRWGPPIERAVGILGHLVREMTD